jgi:predicted TIM-barrel fold metal-dependent hydrolase
MLVTTAHRPDRAASPAVDAHNHLGRWLTGDGRWMVPDVPELIDRMDGLGVRAMVNLDGRWGDELRANLERYDHAHPGRFATFCHVDWRETSSPGFGRRLARSLRASVEAGAAGLKVWKDLGLSVRDPAGGLLRHDHPELAELWAAAGDLGIPVVMHVGDPAAFFEPVDRHNERLEELLSHPNLRLHGRKVPALRTLLEAFELVVAAHPDTTFVAAHMGTAEDLGWVRRMIQTYPNLRVDTSARIAELGRQPRAAASLVRDHPDRVLFGTDVFPPRAEEYRIWFRFLETADEHFDYSTAEVPPHGRWRVSGLALPPEVLRRVYHDNALDAIPALRG